MSIWRFVDSKIIVSAIRNQYWYVPHSRVLQHKATILKELDSMPSDAFRTELCASLISFCEGVLKVPGACGVSADVLTSKAKIIKRYFTAPSPDNIDQAANAWVGSRPWPPRCLTRRRGRLQKPRRQPKSRLQANRQGPVVAGEAQARMSSHE
jgi:hypothetical protein